MTADQQLRIAIKKLHQHGCETPRLDAEILLMHAWDINRTQLLIKAHDTLPEAVQINFEHSISERCQRIPIAYITEKKEFWSRDFKVSPDVLIPRPETEHLIEELLKLYPNTQAPYRFADIGTGSGCIAITIACEYPHARVIATDISEKSLAIARSNADLHGVAERIQFKQGDLYQALPPSDEKLDAIVSNPPYLSVEHMQHLEKELHFEPSHALTDKHDGLQLLTKLLHEAPNWLQPHAYLLLETGLSGLPKTPESMTLHHHYHDLAGHLRGGIYQDRR